MIRAILFDWGDTLVRFPGFSTDGGGHAAVIDDLYAWMAAGAQRECFSQQAITRSGFLEAYRQAARAQFRAMLDSGCDQPMRDRLEQALRDAGCRCDLEPQLAELLECVVVLLCAHSKPMPGVHAVLETLGSRYLPW